MIVYNANAAGPGHPDAGIGRGYGTIDGPGNATRQVQLRGYPYDIDDVGRYELEDDDIELDDEADRIATRTNAGHQPWNTFDMHRRDRRKFASSDVSLGPIESLIRLRPASSEPDPGTMYGWSHAPMWNTPRRRGGVSKPRYADVAGYDPEADFEDQLLSIDALREPDIELVREFIYHVLQITA